MSYFSPRVIGYNPPDPTHYVCPAVSNDFQSPRFSIFPAVAKDPKKALITGSGKPALIPAADVKTAIGHTVARVASVLFATLGTLMLASLAVVTIWFPVIVISQSVLMTLGAVTAAYYLIALTVAFLSKATLKNELIQKPSQLKEPTSELDPIAKSCTVAYAPIQGTRPTPGVAYKAIQAPVEKENKKVQLYDINSVEVAKVHRAARITAFVVGLLATIALIVFGALALFNPASIAMLPLSIVFGVIGGVLAVALLIHAVSKRTLKNEVVQVTQQQLKVSNKAKDDAKAKLINLYRDTADWKNAQFMTKADFQQVEEYKDNYQLTEAYNLSNRNLNNNLGKLPNENSLSYRVGYFFLWLMGSG